MKGCVVTVYNTRSEAKEALTKLQNTNINTSLSVTVTSHASSELAYSLSIPSSGPASQTDHTSPSVSASQPISQPSSCFSARLCFPSCQHIPARSLFSYRQNIFPQTRFSTRPRILAGAHFIHWLRFSACLRCLLSLSDVQWLHWRRQLSHSYPCGHAM